MRAASAQKSTDFYECTAKFAVGDNHWRTQISRVPSSRLLPGGSGRALMIIEPRLDEPVEFLELVFGAGFWRTVFEPAQHVSFDQVARHARMLSVDALH